MAAPVTSATFESVFADIVLWLLYLMQGKKSPLRNGDDIAFRPLGTGGIVSSDSAHYRKVGGKASLSHASQYVSKPGSRAATQFATGDPPIGNEAAVTLCPRHRA